MWRSARDAEERRMRRRGVVVFAISVIATLARSLILDEHYLNQPRAYSIYRTPSACGAQDMNPLESDNKLIVKDHLTVLSHSFDARALSTELPFNGVESSQSIESSH
eukprot:758118-Amphidinium_carterae.1